jgi:multimeric flavodoxin WrbA
MKNLYPKIIGSDVIIFGTPVYWFGPTAIMKCFIDRFVFFNCPANRKKIRNKVGVIAVPFADRTLDMSDLVMGFFEKSLDYLEMRLTDKILVPGVTKRGEVRTRKQVMDKCYRLGKRLAV